MGKKKNLKIMKEWKHMSTYIISIENYFRGYLDIVFCMILLGYILNLKVTVT